MRYQPDLLTYQHDLQRKKKYQKERNNDYCLFNQKGTNHLLQKGDILTCYEHYLNRFCRKLMKCPLILANEMAPSTLGYSMRQPNLGRIYDAVLYSRYGEGYENPRNYFKGYFRRYLLG